MRNEKFQAKIEAKKYKLISIFVQIFLSILIYFIKYFIYN